MININYKAVLFSISIALVLGYFALKSSQSLPDFSVYTNVKEKKEAFFSFMLPLVIKKNLDIRSERQFLLSIRDKSKIEFSSSEISKVKNILIEFHNDEIFHNYNPDKVHQYLIKNNFVLLKKFKFPFTTWEDRFYQKK